MPSPTATEVTPPGRHQSTWTDRLGTAASRSVDELAATVPGRDCLVVLAAHPDDETIGAGRLLSAWWRTRGPTYAVLATAGEACVDHVGARPPGLVERRLAEWAGALDALGVEPAGMLGLPDADLTHHEAELAGELAAALQDLPAPVERVVLLAPHPADPHPDHQAAGRAAHRVGLSLGVPVWSYPVWLTFWAEPGAVEGDELVRVDVDAADSAARTAALGRFTSQTEPLAPGWGPVVPAELLDRHDDQLLVLPHGDLP